MKKACMSEEDCRTVFQVVRQRVRRSRKTGNLIVDEIAIWPTSEQPEQPDKRIKRPPQGRVEELTAFYAVNEKNKVSPFGEINLDNVWEAYLAMQKRDAHIGIHVDKTTLRQDAAANEE